MKKFIISLLLIMFLAPSMIVSAETAAREIQVYLYEDYSDCVINISWENSANKASVRIQNSDDKAVRISDANTHYGKGSISVDVGKAESGYWTVFVTGNDLGIINVSGGEKYNQNNKPNAIRSFEANVTDNDLVFNWLVLSAESDIDVTVRYMSNGYNYTLWSDYHAAKNGSAKIPLDELYTGLYNFSIEVYADGNDYTMSIPDAMYVKQKNAPPKLENVRVGSIDGQVYAKWDAMYDADEYIVMLYDYNTLECISSYSTYDPYITLNNIPDSGKFKLSAAAVTDNIHGEFDVYDMIYTMPVGNIVMPDISVTRSGIVKMTVNCDSNVTAGAYVDDVLLLENAPAGDYDLNLTDGAHDIVAYLMDENGNIRSFASSLTIDKTPPMINILSEEGITSSDKYIIEGNTEPDAVISINGVEQTTGDGKFTAQVTLEDGVNSFLITAYDPAGNSSSKTIIIEKSGSSTNFLIYIIPAAAFVFLTVWYICLNIKHKRGGRK